MYLIMHMVLAWDSFPGNAEKNDIEYGTDIIPVSPPNGICKNAAKYETYGITQRLSHARTSKGDVSSSPGLESASGEANGTGQTHSYVG